MPSNSENTVAQEAMALSGRSASAGARCPGGPSRRTRVALSRYSLALLCLLFSLAGCAASVQDTKGLPCELAAEHLAECSGRETAGTPDTCDASLAERVLNTPCEQLQPTDPAGKLDGFTQTLDELSCAIGFRMYCVPESCQPEQLSETFDECADYIDADGCNPCEYYRCAAERSELSCTFREYYISMGLKYCQRFTGYATPRLSAAGKRWMKRTRACLMNYIEDNVPEDATCSETTNLALSSHAQCYVDNGFCDLPPSDWLQVLNTISPWDNNLMEILTTGVSCLRQYHSRSIF